MCLGYTPDWIVLVSGYYVTCLDLLFSKWSRTDLYLDARLLIMRTDANKDVGHVGKCPRSRTLGAV